MMFRVTAILGVLIRGLTFGLMLWLLLNSGVVLTEEKTFYIGLLNRFNFERLIIASSFPTDVNITSPNDVCNWSNPISLSEEVCNDVISIIPTGNQLTNTGIKVVTSDDVQLQVTISAGGLSESFLVFDEQGLGIEFLVITYCELGGHCQFSIVATKNNTRIRMTFPSEVDPKLICNTSSGASAIGNVVVFEMDELDLLHIEGEVDLSGTHITSNKRIAVFAGARDVPSKINSPTAHFMEQMIPVSKLGTEFVFVPNDKNDAGDVMKIVTTAQNTRMEITGYSPFVQIMEHQVIQKRINRHAHTYISTNYPVLVAQFMSVDMYNDSHVTGTPAMVLVPAVQHFTKTHFFYCYEEIAPQNVSMISATDTLTLTFGDSGSVNVTSSPENVQWTDYNVFSDHNSETGTSVRRLVTGSDVFGAYIYCGTSSAALSGVNLAVYTPGCSKSQTSPADKVDNDCDGEIDEDSCTEADITTTIQLTYNEVSPSSITYPLNGAREMLISLQTCGVGVVTLEESSSNGRMYVIQLSSKFVSIRFYSDNTEKNQTLTNWNLTCANVNVFWILWYPNGALKVGLGEYYQDTVAILTTDEDVNDLELEKFTFTALMADASFSTDLNDKDCGPIYSGGIADEFGFYFLIPTIASNTSLRITSDQDAPNCSVLKLSPGPPTVSSYLGTFYFLTADSLYMVHCSTEVWVYVLTHNDEFAHGFNAIPTDVLGIRYILVADDNGILSTECKVVSLDKFTTVTVTSLNNVVSPSGPQELDPFSVLLISSTGDLTGTEITSSRPVAVFCYTNTNDPFNMEQIPPVSTLGKQFYIPDLDYENSTILDLGVVATADYTHVEVAGDFSEEFLISKGEKHEMEKMSLSDAFSVTTSKAAIVTLSVALDTEKTTTVIPPYEQYHTSCHLPEIAGIFEAITSKQVSINGSVSEGFSQLTSSPINATENSGVFCLSLLKTESGIFLMVKSGMKYAEENEICKLQMNGTSADGLDNDCDQLIDEECCDSDTCCSDFDMDGEINEDCNGSLSGAFKELKEMSEGASVTCTEQTTTVRSTTTNATVTSSGSQTDPTIGTTLQFSMPPTVVPPTSFIITQATAATPTATSAVSTTPATTTQPTTTTRSPNSITSGMCDCKMPCAWCRVKNLSRADITQKVKQIQEGLTLDKKALSHQVRSKTSAKDNRMSAQSIGYLALCFLLLTIGLLIVLDLATLVHDFRSLRENLIDMFQR